MQEWQVHGNGLVNLWKKMMSDTFWQTLQRAALCRLIVSGVFCSNKESPRVSGIFSLLCGL
jgi:c-di-GMP-related signal transduction protein